jgi:hypothetical protein
MAKQMSQLVKRKESRKILDSIMRGGDRWGAFVAKGGDCLNGVENRCPAYRKTCDGGPDGYVCSDQWGKAQVTVKNLEVFFHALNYFDHYNRSDLVRLHADSRRVAELRQFLTSKKEELIFSGAHGENTESSALRKVRKGQEKLRMKLHQMWADCSVTGCKLTRILRTSHIKPWSDWEEDRLNLYNALLLTPNLDAMFEEGLISFKKNGSMLISKRISNKEAHRLGISGPQRLRFVRKGHIPFLSWHHRNVFRLR